MPSTSKKQARFMAAVAHSPAFAKKVGVPVSVGKEFNEADKGVKASGYQTRVDQQKINRPKTQHGKMSLFSKGGDMKESKKMMAKELAFMEKKGAPKSMVRHEEAEMKGMKSGGMSLAKHASMPASKAHKGLKHGGLAAGHKAADGIAKKGKTRGMQVAMKRGGKC